MDITYFKKQILFFMVVAGMILLTACSTTPKVLDGTVKMISSQSHYLMIMEDDSLWGWGANYDKELLAIEDYEIFKPVKIMENVQQVAAGLGYTLALTKEGDLFIWGANLIEQLGLGYYSDYVADPVHIMSDVVQISAGRSGGFAVTSTGELYGWGENKFGEVGTGSKEMRQPIQKILDDVIFVEAGYASSFAIRSDHSLWAWGRNVMGELGITASDEPVLSPTKVMDNVTYVANNLSRTMVIKKDKSAWYFGSIIGKEGTYSIEPIKVAEGCKAAFAGEKLVLLEDDTLWSIRANKEETENGGFEMKVHSSLILENVKDVADQFQFVLFLKNDGSLWGIGTNYYSGWADKEDTWTKLTLMIAPNGGKDIK